MSVNYYLDSITSDFINFFKPNVKHLVQSKYAENYLLSFAKVPEEKILRVYDYISDEFRQSVPAPAAARSNIICYLKDKTTIFTEQLIEACKKEIPGAVFIPIKNFSTNEIIDLLNRSKIFMDLSWHPGKNRMIREAVLLNNCIITSTLGSAKYYEDVRISNKYKIPCFYGNEDIEYGIKIIKDLLENYEERLDDFKDEKEMVKKEKDIFKTQIANLVEDF